MLEGKYEEVGIPMSDRSIIDRDLEELAESLLEPFDRRCVRGASYDIRVGERLRLAPTEVGELPSWHALGESPVQSSIELPPGATCLIQSMERVKVPANMKGRLSLRAQHAKQLLFFAGGIIDPGYNDHLMLPVANLSDEPIRLRYGQPIVAAEFVRFAGEATPYATKRGREDSSSEGRAIALNRVRLSQKVEEYGATLKALREQLDTDLGRLKSRMRRGEIVQEASHWILNVVVLGAVAGGAIGIATQIPEFAWPWNLATAGVGLVVGLIAIGLIVKLMGRGPS